MPDLSDQPSQGDVVVVVAANPTKANDLFWLRRQPYDYAVMTKASPETSIHNLEHNYGPEATSYLHFILLYWDHLPERVIFMHSHWHSWHSWVSTARLAALQAQTALLVD